MAASALPAASLAAVVIVPVYCVLPARSTDGLNVTVLPLTLTVPATAVPPAVASLMLAVLSVALVIASENVAVYEALSATPVAPLAGAVEDTVGGVVSAAAAVVKRQLKLAASALPESSSAAVVMVAVYCVLAVRLAEGVNRAVVPVTLTVPATAAPPDVLTSVKLEPVSVELVIVSENVADTEVLVATPVALFAGDTEDTAGGVVSGVAPVVKRQVKLDCNALPATSFAAVVRVAVYCVLGASPDEGINTTPLPTALTVPATEAPLLVVFTVKLAVVRVVVRIASEKPAETDAFEPTPVAEFEGEINETVGGVVSGGMAAEEFADAPRPTAVVPPLSPPPPQPDKARLAANAKA